MNNSLRVIECGVIESIGDASVIASTGSGVVTIDDCRKLRICARATIEEEIILLGWMLFLNREYDHFVVRVNRNNIRWNTWNVDSSLFVYDDTDGFIVGVENVTTHSGSIPSDRFDDSEIADRIHAAMSISSLCHHCQCGDGVAVGDIQVVILDGQLEAEIEIGIVDSRGREVEVSGSNVDEREGSLKTIRTVYWRRAGMTSREREGVPTRFRNR